WRRSTSGGALTTTRPTAASTVFRSTSSSTFDGVSTTDMGASENISWFAGITLNDRLTVGGKGGSLGELTRAGIAVPPGFVVRTTAFERFLAVLESEEPVRSRVEGLGDHDITGITAL